MPLPVVHVWSPSSNRAVATLIPALLILLVAFLTVGYLFHLFDIPLNFAPLLTLLILFIRVGPVKKNTVNTYSISYFSL